MVGRDGKHGNQVRGTVVLSWVGFGCAAALLLLTACAQETTATTTQGSQPSTSARKRGYGDLSNKEKVAVLARRAAQRGGYDTKDLVMVRIIAREGYAEAQYMVGMIYAYPDWNIPGEGVNRNYGEAHAWFLQAAAQGHAHAAFEVAKDFQRGEGVARDSNEALRWYEVAAKGNHPLAQRTAGVLYTERAAKSGDPQDAAKGVEWLKKAAANDDKEAQRLLKPPEATPEKPKRESIFRGFEPVTTQ